DGAEIRQVKWPRCGMRIAPAFQLQQVLTPVDVGVEQVRGAVFGTAGQLVEVGKAVREDGEAAGDGGGEGEEEEEEELEEGERAARGGVDEVCAGGCGIF